MKDQEIKYRIIDLAKDLGFDIVRIARPALADHHHRTYRRWIAEHRHGDMDYLSRRLSDRIDISQVLPGVRSVIVVGVNYYRPDSRDRREHEGWISRYAVTRDYHKIITKKMKTMCRLITEEFVEAAKAYVDTGPILERAYAESAGIGYIGRNTCLIAEEFGSWIFLGEILTTLEIAPDHNSTKLSCGRCRRCIDRCPTRAINEDRTIDARRCISYLTIENRGPIPVELRDHVGHWLFGCDICQEVCPHNGRAVTAKMDEFNNVRIRDRVLNLSELLAIDSDERFLELFAGSPIMRAKRRGLLRNACVVAGNSNQQRLISDLQRVSKQEDEMLKEHADWAIAKLRGKRVSASKIT